MAQEEVTKHTVKRNDNVADLAKKYKYPSVSLNQMIYVMVIENPNAFALRTARQLKPGYEMVIPPEEKVKAVDAAAADKEVARLREADRNYRQGVATEAAGDLTKATRLYLTAAQMGHGLADIRLGELYDRDNTRTVPRDLAESIRFYQEARKMGLKVRGPVGAAPDISSGH